MYCSSMLRNMCYSFPKVYIIASYVNVYTRPSRKTQENKTIGTLFS